MHLHCAGQLARAIMPSKQLNALSSYASERGSEGGLGASRMSLVNGQVVRDGVVSVDSARVAEGGRSGAMSRLVLEQVPDIVLGEFTVETSLHVSDFLGDDGVVVVEGRLLDESLVQHGLEQEIEVRHESSGIAVLVLGEDAIQSVVDLSIGGVHSLGSGEASEELEAGEEGETVEPARDSNLHERKDISVSHLV